MAKDLSALNSLLKATSKSTVEKCLNLTFISRFQHPSQCVEALKEILELETDKEASDLREALLECIHAVLSSGAIEDLAELFKSKGKDVNQKLKQLVGQTIQGQLVNWKEAASFNRVSLPRLVDFDWTLHMKRSSNEAMILLMQIPSVIMALTIENQPNVVSELPNCQTIDFELSREALETVIDGLGKIRDQLAQMS